MSKLTMMIKVVLGIPSVVHAHWNNRSTQSVYNPRTVRPVRRYINIGVMGEDKTWTMDHGPPLWTGSMDHFHGPGPWTPCHGPGPHGLPVMDRVHGQFFFLNNEK